MREIVPTRDGSHTVSIPARKVTYHSVHGAVRESMHVFIDAGLRRLLKPEPGLSLQIFEMGFGTGLNAFLTALEAEKTQTKIVYTAVEALPLTRQETQVLNYPATLGHADLFHRMHDCPWNEAVSFTSFFTLQKHEADLFHFRPRTQFNLIYFDAFAPSAQPELWTTDVFEKLFFMLQPGGSLVTYCSKSTVRRAMEAAGFNVKRVPRPPGKREMLRAEKTLYLS